LHKCGCKNALKNVIIWPGPNHQTNILVPLVLTADNLLHLFTVVLQNEAATGPKT